MTIGVPKRAPYAFRHGDYDLEVTGRAALGVVTLEHEWQAGEDAAPQTVPQLRVYGPCGEQMWFRTFDPLTLSAVLPELPAAEQLSAAAFLVLALELALALESSFSPGPASSRCWHSLLPFTILLWLRAISIARSCGSCG